MTIDYSVPFFSNTPDDTHCAQATLRMVRKYFEPQLDFTWQELDNASAKSADTTWRMAGLLWLQENNYDVQVIELFDYTAFGEYGATYLTEFYSPEVAEFEIATGDIPTESLRARTFAKQVTTQKRLPSQLDIERYLEMGYLVQITVNIYRFRGMPGYWGHAVLVKGFDSRGFILHDPGLPAVPNRYIDREMLEAAWSDAGNAKNLVALRKS